MTQPIDRETIRRFAQASGIHCFDEQIVTKISNVVELAIAHSRKDNPPEADKLLQQALEYVQFEKDGRTQSVEAAHKSRDDLLSGIRTYEIQFRCRMNSKKICVVPLTLGPNVNDDGNKVRRWHWDGNMQSPTVTPSIGCDARCGWHGHMTSGELAP